MTSYTNNRGKVNVDVSYNAEHNAGADLGEGRGGGGFQGPLFLYEE